MPRRYLFVTLFLISMGLVAGFGYLQTEKTTTTRLMLENAGGRVVFNHKQHATDFKVPCVTCHHDGSDTPCGTCHGLTFDDTFRTSHATAMKDKALCSTCHHKSFAAASWSHEAHASEYDLSCTDCHHNDPDIESEPGRCSACHLKKPVGTLKGNIIPDRKTAAHTKCVTCHQDMFDAGIKGCAKCHAFTDNRKPVPAAGAEPVGTTSMNVSGVDADCRVCHATTKTEDLIAPRMKAFHSLCLKCHEAQGKGPFGKDQCNQCHMK